MNVDKDLILDLLKKQGRNDNTAAASRELPDKVDTDKNADLLSRFGIDANDLLDKLPGGLGDKLGGLLGGEK